MKVLATVENANHKYVGWFNDEVDAVWEAREHRPPELLMGLGEETRIRIDAIECSIDRVQEPVTDASLPLFVPVVGRLKIRLCARSKEDHDVLRRLLILSRTSAHEMASSG